MCVSVCVCVGGGGGGGGKKRLVEGVRVWWGGVGGGGGGGGGVQEHKSKYSVFVTKFFQVLSEYKDESIDCAGLRINITSMQMMPIKAKRP